MFILTIYSLNIADKIICLHFNRFTEKSSANELAIVRAKQKIVFISNFDAFERQLEHESLREKHKNPNTLEYLNENGFCIRQQQKTLSSFEFYYRRWLIK